MTRRIPSPGFQSTVEVEPRVDEAGEAEPAVATELGFSARRSEHVPCVFASLTRWSHTEDPGGAAKPINLA